LSVYNTLTISALRYGSEIWTLHEKDKSRITIAEMNLLRKTTKYMVFDHTRNHDVLKAIKTQPV
jgi:hypothetical protein